MIDQWRIFNILLGLFEPNACTPALPLSTSTSQGRTIISWQPIILIICLDRLELLICLLIGQLLLIRKLKFVFALAFVFLFGQFKSVKRMLFLIRHELSIFRRLSTQLPNGSTCGSSYFSRATVLMDYGCTQLLTTARAISNQSGWQHGRRLHYVQMQNFIYVLMINACGNCG